LVSLSLKRGLFRSPKGFEIIDCISQRISLLGQFGIYRDKGKGGEEKGEK
jgi:hypothetical protein